MSQSRRHSMIEAIAGTAIGFIVSVLASYVVYPAFGHAFTLAQNISITAIIAAPDLAGLAACMMPVTAWPSAIKSRKGRALEAETATATASRCHGAGR